MTTHTFKRSTTSEILSFTFFYGVLVLFANLINFSFAEFIQSGSVFGKNTSAAINGLFVFGAYWVVVNFVSVILRITPLSDFVDFSDLDALILVVIAYLLLPALYLADFAGFAGFANYEVVTIAVVYVLTLLIHYLLGNWYWNKKCVPEKIKHQEELENNNND